MPRNIQEPTEEVRRANSGETETILKHPAFGQITLNKVSGQQVLFGSDFVHHNYVSIRIHECELRRSLSRDSRYDSPPFVEVMMSEAQWATFVSSFGVGEGTPCTIRSRDRKSIPEFPLRDSSQEYKKEGDAHLKRAVSELETLLATMEAGTSGLTKKKAEELLAPVRQAIRELHSTLPFVADSFSKFMEKRTEHAKVEVNAYINSTIQRAGLAALMQNPDYRPPLEIQGPEDTNGDEGSGS